MNYRLLTSPNDEDISLILSVYKIPSVSHFISIDETNYWKYVAETNNVWFYKVYDDGYLTSTLHLELSNNVLYMGIVVFPEFQKKGIATKILKDILNGRFCIEFNKVQVSIDENNIASIKLFENAGFLCASKDAELFEYVYLNNKAGDQ